MKKPTISPSVDMAIKLAHVFNDNPRLAVIGIHTQTKKPAGLWKRVIDGRLFDDDELRALWLQFGGRMNIGIACGIPSGVAVMDADNQAAIDYIEKNLPPTPMQVRTKKGRHFYFRQAEGVIQGNRGDVFGSKRKWEYDAQLAGFDVRSHFYNDQDAQKQENDRVMAAMKAAWEAGIRPEAIIDVRGTGGQVVGPGSVKDDGFVYEMVEPWTPEMFERVPLWQPEWVAEELKWKRPVKTGAVTIAKLKVKETDEDHERRIANFTDDEKYRRAAGWLKHTPGAIEGQRGHDHTFYVACRLCNGWDLGPDATYELMLGWNASCQPPWTDVELAHKINDAEKLSGAENGKMLVDSPAFLARKKVLEVERYSVDPRDFRGTEHDNGGPAAPDGGEDAEGAPGASTSSPPGNKENPRPTNDLGAGGGGGKRPTNGVPIIIIQTDEQRMINEAVSAIAGQKGVYQRGGALVRVMVDANVPAGSVVARGAPRIERLPLPQVRLLMSRSARWMKFDQDSRGLTFAHVPDFAAKQVETLGMWKGVRPLVGVVEHPILRPDGTLLLSRGYDLATGLFLALPKSLKLTLPPSPTLDDALAAKDELLDLICDFPVKDDGHKAAWLAALLTPLARHAYAGPTPLTTVEANVRAAGKSKLVDVISNVICGRDMPRTPYSDEDAEMRKKLTGMVLEGTGMTMFDNVTTMFGSGSLDAALTSTTWADRALGLNTSVRGAFTTILFMTGNNVQIAGDTARRVLPIRIEHPDAQPESRTTFKHPALLEFVRARRAHYLTAALTILAAHGAAGRPKDPNLKPWGSFEAWSDVVRQAIVWLGMPDPISPREGFMAMADTEGPAHARLLEVLFEHYGQGVSFTARDALTFAQAPDDEQRDDAAAACAAALLDALDDLCPRRPGVPLDARMVGRRFKHVRGRVAGDLSLVEGPRASGGMTWLVKDVTAGFGAPV